MEKVNSPMNHILLNSGVGDLPSNQPFESKDGVLGVNNPLGNSEGQEVGARSRAERGMYC